MFDPAFWGWIRIWWGGGNLERAMISKYILKKVNRKIHVCTCRALQNEHSDNDILVGEGAGPRNSLDPPLVSQRVSIRRCVSHTWHRGHKHWGL